jgi:hypothetical protein
MRAPHELIELPYTFTQLRPLVARQFISEARARGVSLTDAQLEGLHRARVLVPLLRARRDGRAIAGLVRSGRIHDADQVAHWESTNRLDLAHASEHGLLSDPAAEPFVARRRLRRTIGDIEYYASEYLYSPHQLMMLPVLKQARGHFRYRGNVENLTATLDADRWWRESAQARERWTREVVVAVSALEPAYYPSIIQRLTLPMQDEFDRYDRWRQRLPLLATRKWLQVDADWIRETARALLALADGIDPLGDWLQLVREAHPDRWTKLKGEARTALDYRIAAEILLRYYDDLARGRRARPLEKPAGPREPSEFASRLKPQRDLDALLTDFGLSPHPSLILVVEGETEYLLFPRVMDLFGIRRDEDFIRIENMRGVGKDLGSLLAFAVAPRTSPDEYGRYLRPVRPLTRILVVTDAEGPMTTREQRRKRRGAWVERILWELPAEQRTPAVRQSLERLVYLETWRRSGLSFEFAHFTDRQLATAIASLDRRERQPTLTDRIGHVARVRAQRANLDQVLHRTSKPDLADELWPLLERKIRRAMGTRTEARIPIVRVLDRATHLAREMPRRNFVIPLRRAS